VSIIAQNEVYFIKWVEQSFKMAIFMVETKSTCASTEILAKPVRANKCILIEVFIPLIWRSF